MKTTIFTKLMCGIALFGAITLSSSCKKEEDKKVPPAISFKSGTGYTNANGNFGMNDTIVVGINASKTEAEDNLKKFTVTQQYDGGTVNTTQVENFDLDNYTTDVTIVTRAVAGTEKYTFTIINRDGLTASKSLVLYVN